MKLKLIVGSITYKILDTDGEGKGDEKVDFASSMMKLKRIKDDDGIKKTVLVFVEQEDGTTTKGDKKNGRQFS